MLKRLCFIVLFFILFCSFINYVNVMKIVKIVFVHNVKENLVNVGIYQYR